MFGTIIWILAGVLIGYGLSGARKLARIRSLNKEKKMLLDRNIACSNTNVQLTADLVKERDKTRDQRRDLLLWEGLADEIQKHPHPPMRQQLKTVPETGIQLLQYYREKL